MTYDLPERRYALFADVLHGTQLVIITGRDLDTAHKWGGFISWFGATKPAVKIGPFKESPGKS